MKVTSKIFRYVEEYCYLGVLGNLNWHKKKEADILFE